MIRYVAVKSDLEKAADFWFAWFQNSLFRAYMHTHARAFLSMRGDNSIDKEF